MEHNDEEIMSAEGPLGKEQESHLAVEASLGRAIEDCEMELQKLEGRVRDEKAQCARLKREHEAGVKAKTATDNDAVVLKTREDIISRYKALIEFTKNAQRAFIAVRKKHVTDTGQKLHPSSTRH